MRSIAGRLLAMAVLLGMISVHGAWGGDRAVELRISTDPKLVGVWQTVAQTYAGQVTYNLEISPEGGYRLAPNSGIDAEIGVFESGSGQWRMTSSAGRKDAGKYEFLADDKVRISGASAAVEWTRASRDVKPDVPAEQKTAEGLPVLSLHGVAISPEVSFASLRADADVLAATWDAKAALCRADLIGSYSRSRPRFQSIRLVYFRPDDSSRGFEVVYDSAKDSGRIYGEAYPFTEANGLSAVPANVIDPREAIERLWELEPCAPPDKVCLQLIKPGVEQPLIVDADRQTAGQRSSYPRAEFMDKFGVPVGDDESKAPKDRFAWRMLAVRDFDASLGQPYAGFVYVDAVDGRPLSARGPAVVGADVSFLKVPEGSPVPIFDFETTAADKPIAIEGPGDDPATFDLLEARQHAESLSLGLRRLIAEGKSDTEIGGAIERVAAWSEAVDSLHDKADAQGLSLLENAARQDPKNAALHALLAHRYVDEVEKERIAMLRVLPPVLRFDASTLVLKTGASVALDPQTATWVYGIPDFELHVYPRLARLQSKPSKFFAAASAELANVLAMDAAQPMACVDQARLERMETLGWDDQYAACERALKADPGSAMANELFATYPAQWNQDKLDQAAQLRSVGTWFSTDVRFGPDVIITTTYKNFAYPSAAEIAGAEQSQGEAQQMQVWAAGLKDRAMKLAPLDPKIYFLTGRALADHLDMRDRLACDGLLADPGNPQLHALRGRTYEEATGGQPVLDAVSDAATTFDDPYNVRTCLTLAQRCAGKDAFTSYCAALQAVRMAPADPEAHLALAMSLEHMDGYILQGVELMPDAMEQARLEYAVTAKIATWAASRPGANGETLGRISKDAESARARCDRAIN